MSLDYGASCFILVDNTNSVVYTSKWAGQRYHCLKWVTTGGWLPAYQLGVF